jgi:poly(3-hydroxybutyrate) depolymerase
MPVKADPMPGCVVTKPQNIVVVSAKNDTAVPYQPGDKGTETPAATVEIADLQAALKCSTKPTTATHGGMTLTTWACADGKTLEWALYQSGGHGFPVPAGATP